MRSSYDILFAVGKQFRRKETFKSAFEKIAALARQFAESFGEGDCGELLDLFHDAGKASEKFQDVLERKEHGINHETCGAFFLWRNKRGPLARVVYAHHKGIDPNIADRWTPSVIVTTSVKFFETLFRRMPADIRFLHSIANGVIVFDEAQSLPKEVEKQYKLIGKRALMFSCRFCPKLGIAEDPVCGSAHCRIAAYRAKTLCKNEIYAYQASKRGGYLHCEMKENRIAISGEATLVAVSEIVAKL